MITQTRAVSISLQEEREAISRIELTVSDIERSESGVLAYFCLQSEENPSQLLFFEIYRDEEAVRRIQRLEPRMGLDPALITVTKLDRVAAFYRGPTARQEEERSLPPPAQVEQQRDQARTAPRTWTDKPVPDEAHSPIGNQDPRPARRRGKPN